MFSFKESIYKGVPITKNFYGQEEYTIQWCGDDIWFTTLKEAKEFVEEMIKRGELEWNN